MLYLLARIYYQVRIDERKANKWRFEATQTSTTVESSSWYLEQSDSPEFLRPPQDSSAMSSSVEEGTTTTRTSRSFPTAARERGALGLLTKLSLDTFDSSDLIMVDEPEEEDDEDDERECPRSLTLPVARTLTRREQQHQQQQLRQQQRQQQRRHRSHVVVRQRSNLERKVFRQCLSYIVGFCLVYPTSVALGYYFALTQRDGFGAFVFLAICAPLQGLANAIVYFRPRLCCNAGSSRNSNKNNRTEKTPSIGSTHNTSTKKQSIDIDTQTSSSNHHAGHGGRSSSCSSGQFAYNQSSISSLQGEWDPTSPEAADEYFDDDEDEDDDDEEEEEEEEREDETIYYDDPSMAVLHF